MNARAPDWPAMPEEVCFQRDIFREAGLLTQTHCVVTWIIADARGAPMFSDKRGTFICRSDDGKLPIDPVDYGRWAPIKTAPKDGTRILLYRAGFGEDVAVCWWNKVWGAWMPVHGDSFPDATHWMKLPEPPK